MNFDYLLSMPLYSLTKDKIEELQKKITEKKAQIKHLEDMTEADIWMQELDAFEEVYKKELTSKGYPLAHPTKSGIPIDSYQSKPTVNNRQSDKSPKPTMVSKPSDKQPLPIASKKPEKS